MGMVGGGRWSTGGDVSEMDASVSFQSIFEPFAGFLSRFRYLLLAIFSICPFFHSGIRRNWDLLSRI